MKAKRYHPLLVTLHWLLAVLLITLLAGATLSQDGIQRIA